MLELIKLNEGNEVSTLEIAKMTGKEHTHVLRDVREKINQSKVGLVEGKYKDAKGEMRNMYLLTQEQAVMLLNSYDGGKYLPVIVKWFIEQSKPKTTLELLELAVSELRAKEEQVKQLEHKNEIQGSTINRLVHSKQTYTTTLLAKELGFRSAIELNKILEAQNIQFKHNGVWVLYAKYSGCGYTETKQTILDNGKLVYDRVWTGLGRDFIVGTIVR